MVFVFLPSVEVARSPGDTLTSAAETPPRRVAQAHILANEYASQCPLRRTREIEEMESCSPEEQTHDRELDITAETCPMTFVRTRLALDRMQPGQILRVLLKGEEPLGNVPRTATEQGHAVLRQERQPDGATALWIRKKP